MKKSLFLLIIFFSGKLATAQTAATNTGILYITSSSDILYAGSDFTNNSGSALTNNGQLYIKGNLSNGQSSMAVGTGTLYLNGTSAQSVNGSQTFKTYNLNTNNSAGITLNNDLSVSGVHTFSSGLITTSATPNYLVYEAGSSYSGDGDSKHVNGWIKKYGNTTFAFPVGDATYERTAAITSLSASSEFNCKYYTPTFNTTIPYIFTPLIQVHAGEYWQINEISGGSAKVTLNWDNSKVAMESVAIGDIRVAFYSASYWRDGGGSATGNVTTTGSITSFPGTSFSLPFTLGYSATVLPLKIISFKAVRISGTSFLHWVTEDEHNVDHFDIQSSDDGIHFSTIGTTNARNIISQQQYDFEDHAPLTAVRFYRIRSVNMDGTYMYSGIVTVSQNDTDKGSLFIVSNPVHINITLFNRTNQSGSFDYRLLNVAGQTVQVGNLNLSANSTTAFALSPSVIPGIYVLELRKGAIQFKQKVLVE